MNIQIEARLYDTGGNLIALFDQPFSASWTKLTNKVSSLTFTINGNDSRAMLFATDYLLEIKRRDLDAGLAWYTEFIGLVRDQGDTYDQSGLHTYTVTALGLLYLLQDRSIVPAVGSELDSYNAPGDSAIYNLVNKNVGPGAVDSARRLSGLTVTVAAGVGPTIVQDFRWNDQLLQALQGISDACWLAKPGVDFDVVWGGATTPASVTFNFKTYSPQLGTDRTYQNAFSNPATIFSQAYGNMEAPTYLLGRDNEATFAYVLGAGSGGSRQVFSVALNAASDSPWNRHEIVVDAQNVTSQAMATVSANAELYKRRKLQQLSFNPMQTSATRYGRDWVLGDLVTAYFSGQQFTCRVMGVTITFDQNFEKIKGIVQSAYAA